MYNITKKQSHSDHKGVSPRMVLCSILEHVEFANVLNSFDHFSAVPSLPRYPTSSRGRLKNASDPKMYSTPDHAIDLRQVQFCTT